MTSQSEAQLPSILEGCRNGRCWGPLRPHLTCCTPGWSQWGFLGKPGCFWLLDVYSNKKPMVDFFGGNFHGFSWLIVASLGAFTLMNILKNNGFSWLIVRPTNQPKSQNKHHFDVRVLPPQCWFLGCPLIFVGGELSKRSTIGGSSSPPRDGHDNMTRPEVNSGTARTIRRNGWWRDL